VVLILEFFKIQLFKLDQNYTNLLRMRLLDLVSCPAGISKAEFLETEAPRLEKMAKFKPSWKAIYMENNFDKD
jgi:epoxyqueuosine reductase